MYWRSRNKSLDTDELSGSPPQGREYQWGTGVGLALALLTGGIFFIIEQDANIGSRMNPIHLHGGNAIAMGIVLISAGLFTHCHYFWGNLYDQWWPAELGKIVGLIGFVGGLIFVLIRNGIWGMR
jgi:hypothetical protein